MKKVIKKGILKLDQNRHCDSINELRTMDLVLLDSPGSAKAACFFFTTKTGTGARDKLCSDTRISKGRSRV